MSLGYGFIAFHDEFSVRIDDTGVRESTHDRLANFTRSRSRMKFS